MAVYTHLLGDIDNGLGETSLSELPDASRWLFRLGQHSTTELVFDFFAFGKWYTGVLFGSFTLGQNGTNDFGTINSVTAVYRYGNVGGSNVLIDRITGISEPWPNILGGDDTYHGSNGRDVLRGPINYTNGSDTFFGGGGDDYIFGGVGPTGGHALIYGGAGNDILGGDGRVQYGREIYGGSGNDDIGGSLLADSLYGGADNDTIYGGDGNDIYTANGDDILNGGRGADFMVGGVGSDTYYVDNPGDVVAESDNVASRPDVDTIFTTISLDLSNGLNGGAAIEILDARSATSGIMLTGNNFTVSIKGGAGNDVLTGAPFTNAATQGVTFDGRGGDDTMVGSDYGEANDIYFVDSAGDVIIDTGVGTIPGRGIDTVYASVSYTLGAGQRLENLIADARSTGLGLTGNEFANSIRGGRGDDTLSGGAGVDKLIGAFGADTFVLQKSQASRDKISDFAHGVDHLGVSESLFGELDGPSLGFADRFLANTDGSAMNGGTVDTRFIYDQTTGYLYFDADGSGALRGVVIAILTTAPVLDAGDFLII